LVCDIGGDMMDVSGESEEDAGVVMLLTRPKSPMQMHTLGPPLAVPSVLDEEDVVCVRQGAHRPRSMLPCLEEDEA
jgi:hypothetical protein